MESGRTVAASAAPPTFQVHDFSCGPGSDGPKDPPVGERRKSSVCVTSQTTPVSTSPPSHSGSATPKCHPSPSRSSISSSASNRHLQVSNPSSIFRQPKHKVKLLKKTASVKQLYNSVLSAIKTIARSSDDSIVPELTKTFFEKLLRKCDESPKLHVTKVKVKDEKEFGRHFCSEVHAVEVTARIKSGDIEEVRKYHLIVKSQPQSSEAEGGGAGGRPLMQHNLASSSHTFEKEVQMYSQVFHDMANFVRKESVITLNCKDSEVIDVPRCYYTKWAADGHDTTANPTPAAATSSANNNNSSNHADSNHKEDLIILENLYPQGFTFALGQDNGLDRRHAELVIRELAKFHAISYCMKDDRGGNQAILDSYAYLKEDSLYRPSTSDFTKRAITPVMASLAELIRNTPGYEGHYEWFVELARNFHTIQTEMVRPKNQFAVICHGDLWLSNILFRYSRSPPVSADEQEQQDSSDLIPSEVKFIDFQSARFASLATDLNLFLFTSVQVDLRREMLGELVSLYYTTFLVSVRSLNVTGDIYQMEELFIEIENHIIYGFLEGIWYLDIVHRGHVPKASCHQQSNDDNSDVVDGHEMQDTLDMSESRNEDDREEAELKRMQRRSLSDDNEESQEQKDYKEEFFELLDEVLFLLGKAGVPSNEAAAPPHGLDSSGKKNVRRSLRDTSQRFGRRSSHESAANRGSPRLSREESSPRGSLTSSLTPSPKCKAKSAPNSHQGSRSAKKQE